MSFPLRLAIAVVAAGAISFSLPPNAAAEPEWPTPPPAARAPMPVIQGISAPVTAPLASGGTVWQVQPIPQYGPPAIPPVPSDTFSVPGELSIRIEAGSLDRTAQLAYLPTTTAQAPATADFQQVLKAFDLETYDHAGRDYDPELRRPWILEAPLSGPLASLADPSRLVFARLEAGRWLPLVTTYSRSSQTLVARVLKPGSFAIIAEGPPV